MNLFRYALFLAIGLLLTAHASQSGYEEISTDEETAPLLGGGTTAMPSTHVQGFHTFAGGFSILTGAVMAALGPINMRDGLFGMGASLLSTPLQILNFTLIIGSIVFLAISIILRLFACCNGR